MKQTLYIMADGSSMTASELVDARGCNHSTAKRLLEHACVDKGTKEVQRGRACVVDGKRYGSLQGAADDVGIPASTLRSKIVIQEPGYAFVD